MNNQIHSLLSPYPVLQLQDMGKGPNMEGGRVSNGLSCLVKMIIQTCPVKDPHAEQVYQVNHQRTSSGICPSTTNSH